MTTLDRIRPKLSFDPAQIPADLWIDGKWHPTAERIDVVDPSTGGVVASVADASAQDALDAVAAAYAALPGWAATAPRKRSEALRRCFELMLERKAMLAELIALENGKALGDAEGEVAYAAEFFRWFAEEAVRLNGELYAAPSGAHRIVVQHQPIGVAVLVTPWNFPAAMATRKIAPALAAGCTCVLKPASATPLTAYALAEIYVEAGVPAGVVNVVTTSKSGPAVGAMLHDPRVRKLSFTGSTEVGRALLKEAADQVLSCSMELGGNAPFVVFDDADLEAALDGAMVAKMRNGGEACTSANRFLVQRGVAEPFAEALAERMAALTVGPGYDKATRCGPMIDRAAVTHIAALVEDAVGRGAEITREEIFGPVAAITAFDSEDEAVRLANATEFGLVAYVYTGDLARGLRVSERIESGMVGLNRGLVSDPASPFGGVKQSGLGREGAHHGILEFCETKYIAASW
jgi:succinate-semialdehyde dehydrogenase/glutarate-semialdehyde dehydrogenase